MSMYGLEEGHQCQGEHVFEYGVYVHQETVRNAGIYLTSEEFANPIKCITRPVSCPLAVGKAMGAGTRNTRHVYPSRSEYR
jgi:hypothetical protein